MATPFPTMRALLAVLPFDDRDRAAIDRTLSTRGKTKDTFKANPPPMMDDEHAYAAWMALVGTLAPSRLSIGGLLYLGSEAKDAYERIDRVATVYRVALYAYARPYRWNTWHHTYDVDKARQGVADALLDERGGRLPA